MQHSTRAARWVCLVAALLAAPGVAAQGYPSRPIEVVVATGPGAGNDRVGRLFAEILTREKLVSQPVTVLNKVGGAGGVAFAYMRSRRGDPHVILSGVGASFLSASLRPELGVNFDDITPLAMLGSDPQAVIVSAESPYRTIKDLVEAAKREPGSIVSGIGSPTSTGRMMAWSLERETGGTFRAVSFKGGAAAILAVMGGHVHLSTENVSEGLAAVHAKQVRVLAVAAAHRLVLLPDVPTFRELGYDIQLGTTRGFATTAGVPKATLDHLESVLERVYQSAAWKEHAQASLYDNVWMGSAEFGRFVAQRRLVVQEFLRSIGVIAKP